MTVRSMAGFGVIASHSRPMLAGGVPEGNDFEKLSLGTVVRKVLRPHKVEASDFRVSRTLDSVPDARLLNKRLERLFEVGFNRTRRSEPIFAPPLSRAMNLPQRLRLDTNYERQDQPYFLS